MGSNMSMHKNLQNSFISESFSVHVGIIVAQVGYLFEPNKIKYTEYIYDYCIAKTHLIGFNRMPLL